MENTLEAPMDEEEQKLAAELEKMSAVEWYRYGRPTGAEYEAYVNALLEIELFSEERLAETRRIIEKIGRGQYTLDPTGRIRLLDDEAS